MEKTHFANSDLELGNLSKYVFDTPRLQSTLLLPKVVVLYAFLPSFKLALKFSGRGRLTDIQIGKVSLGVLEGGVSPGVRYPVRDGSSRENICSIIE